MAYYKLATKHLSPRFDPSNVLEFNQPIRVLSALEGEYAGDWTFFADVGDRLPRSAWRLRILETPPYRVVAERYCVASECDSMSRELLGMIAPRPTADDAILADWRRIVSAEKCDPLRPVTMPDPRIPPEEMRRGITGVVKVKVFRNSCGDVRDAEVAISSGNRNLDRAALKEVLRWRIPVATPGLAPWSLQTLQFSMDNPRNPKMGPGLDVFPASGGPVQPKKR